MLSGQAEDVEHIITPHFLVKLSFLPFHPAIRLESGRGEAAGTGCVSGCTYLLTSIRLGVPKTDQKPAMDQSTAHFGRVFMQQSGIFMTPYRLAGSDSYFQSAQGTEERKDPKNAVRVRRRNGRFRQYRGLVVL